MAPRLASIQLVAITQHLGRTMLSAILIRLGLNAEQRYGSIDTRIARADREAVLGPPSDTVGVQVPRDTSFALQILDQTASRPTSALPHRGYAVVSGLAGSLQAAPVRECGWPG